MGVAAIAVLPTETVREVVATASATLFESTPFILAATLAGRFARVRRALPLLGCGCGGGPAARSLPAAAATWLAFGPWVALARWAAAMAVGRLVDRGGRRHDQPGSALDGLAGLVPYALVAGTTAHVLALIGASLPGGPGGAAIGAVAAFALVRKKHMLPRGGPPGGGPPGGGPPPGGPPRGDGVPAATGPPGSAPPVRAGG